MPGASERDSTRDKCHEERVSAYAKAGSSLREFPRIFFSIYPQKPKSAFLLLCSLTSDITGDVPHHHLTLSVKELTYSSN